MAKRSRVSAGARPYDRVTVEPARLTPGEWRVYGHGTYVESSVLAGQPSRTFLSAHDHHDDALAEARTYGVQVDVLDGSSYSADLYHVPSAPPAGFDPADAGEAW
jgi:hypothetical protein